MVDVRVSVPTEVLFPGTTADMATLCSLLGTLSRGDVLFTSARLNLVVSNPNGPPSAETQAWAARRFLGPDERRRLARFASSHGGADGFLLFCRAQLLEVMRWACLVAKDRPGEGATFNDPRARSRFVQASLIAGELWERRTYPNGINLSDDRGADRIGRMTSLRAGTEATRQAPELMRALARCSATYDARLEQHWPGSSGLFQEATGLSLAQYAAFATAFQMQFCEPTPASEDVAPCLFDSRLVGQSLQPAAREMLPKFFALESQTADQLREAFLDARGGIPKPLDTFSLKPLYDRPLLRAADGRAVALDSVIFVEKVSLGPLFHLVRKSIGRGGANSLFAAFGYCFEEYAQDLLEMIWPGLLRGPTRIASSGDEELSDAAVVVGNRLFLFEVKSAFVRDNTTYCESSDEYLAELRDKYVESQKDGKPVAKGVGQLAATVRRIAADGFLLAAGDLDGVSHIHAVLVSRDGALDTLGHIEFFSREFDKVLAPQCPRDGSASLACGRYAVEPLVLATIDDLENVEASCALWNPTDLLAEYVRHERHGSRPSLGDFMIAAQDRYPRRRSSVLAGMAFSKLQEAEQILYLPAP